MSTTDKQKVIQQSKISRYKELLDCQKELESLKDELVVLLQSGAKCAPGTLGIKLKVRAGQRRVAWGDLYTELAREKFGTGTDEHLRKLREDTPPGAPSYMLETFDRENPLEV
jgi:hypothetical protein